MKKINGGLNTLPEDTRDFSLAGIYKQIDIKDVPNTGFIVATPLVMKDQVDTDLCSSFAATEVSEDQEGEELLPEYQFFKTKFLMKDFDSWGADLRMTCKSLVKFGSLPKAQFENLSGIPRHNIVSPETWPEEFDTISAKYKKETFFSATRGRYDTFDNMRSWLWQHRANKCTIITGAAWRSLWTNAKGGVIPNVQSSGEFGHAFKIYGQEIKNGELHLVAQLSNGTDIGDGGIFYFPREVINKEIPQYGGFMFKDIEREEVERILLSGEKINILNRSWLGRIFSFINNLIKNI